MRRAAVLIPLLLAVSNVRAADLVLHDAAVYTVNDKQPWASALVIHDGRIVYVGDETGLKPYLTGARVLDLHGAMVLPGFHDAHMHPLSGGLRLIQCNLAQAKTLQDVETIIKEEAAARPAHPWIFCNDTPPLLAMHIGIAQLDAWVPDRPVFLRDTVGDHAWVNSKALQAGGIDPQGVGESSPSLPRDPRTHRPLGSLSWDAVTQVREKAPSPTADEYRAALQRASALANGAGITSLFDAAATPGMLEAYHAADVDGQLTLRVTAAQRVDAEQGSAQIDEMVKQRARLQGKRFKADAAKIFLDGEIGSFTATMLAPYEAAPQSDTRGPVIPQYQLDEVVQELDAEGFLIHMHAMGDGAVRAGLDAIEHTIQRHGPADRRDQIAHVGVADPKDIPRFAKLGVIADFTPLWFQVGDAAFDQTRLVLGPQRFRWMYPMGSVVTTGAHVTIGSDWPQETLSPLDEIQYALTRQPLDGSAPTPQPEQRITLAQALVAYTRDAAYAVRDEKLDGTLEAGKAADIVVLDQNLFKIDVMSIHKVHVLLTLLDGEPVYRNASFALPEAGSR